LQVPLFALTVLVAEFTQSFSSSLQKSIANLLYHGLTKKSSPYTAGKAGSLLFHWVRVGFLVYSGNSSLKNVNNFVPMTENYCCIGCRSMLKYEP
jgi:uncharacterized membrane protein SpoIIM required for sporulation